MRLFHSFTRGGHLFAQQCRMFKQTCVVAFVISLCIGMSVGSTLFFMGTRSYQRYIYQEYLCAKFRVSINFDSQKRVTQKFRGIHGKFYTVNCASFIKSPWVLTQVYVIETAFKRSVVFSIGAVLLSMFLITGFFLRRGLTLSRKKLERGSYIVQAKALKKSILKTRQDSDLTLGELPLLKNKETSHILITGTTGSGKTNCFHTFLPQIRSRSNRAIIVDLTGEYVTKYYRLQQDILLNPFDKRSQSWSPWEECLTEAYYDTLAAAIVPASLHLDKFWENAGKALLSTALKELAQEKDILKLYHILVRANLTTFSKFFQVTDAASYTHPEGEKMTLSIRATLATYLQGFRFLRQEGTSFSIRKWIEDTNPQDSWLFLSARPDQRETLLPLMSGWLDTAINALMSLSPDEKRRFWFIVDELPSLQRLPSLSVGLAEGRKYGGCFLAGVQSIPQLSSLYGQAQAQALLDLFNTKVFFRNTDPHTTAWISKVLGQAETTEHVENLSYGAHAIREGISLAQQTHIKPLILPTQISDLKDCEAYLKLPSNLPITKIRMKFINLPEIAPAFDLVSKEYLQMHQQRLREIED